MPSAKEQAYFPYKAKTVCYILDAKDGTVQDIPLTKADITSACQAVQTGPAQLF